MCTTFPPNGQGGMTSRPACRNWSRLSLPWQKTWPQKRPIGLKKTSSKGLQQVLQYPLLPGARPQNKGQTTVIRVWTSQNQVEEPRGGVPERGRVVWARLQDWLSLASNPDCPPFGHALRPRGPLGLTRSFHSGQSAGSRAYRPTTRHGRNEGTWFLLVLGARD